MSQALTVSSCVEVRHLDMTQFVFKNIIVFIKLCLFFCTLNEVELLIIHLVNMFRVQNISLGSC